jgi:hypothetical protein
LNLNKNSIFSLYFFFKNKYNDTSPNFKIKNSEYSFFFKKLNFLFKNKKPIINYSLFTNRQKLIYIQSLIYQYTKLVPKFLIQKLPYKKNKKFRFNQMIFKPYFHFRKNQKKVKYLLNYKISHSYKFSFKKHKKKI